MSFTFKLARRTARLRAAVCGAAILSALACNSEDSTAPIAAPEPTPAADVPAADTPTPELLTSATAPGVAFGDFHLPTTMFRAPYTGALLQLYPSGVSSILSRAKSSGLRVVVNLAGGRKYFKNADGTFNLTKWKNRVAAWRGSVVGSYVSSGTIIGHYLVDEPYCIRCWGGKRITTAQIEEMARYSKSIWPSMATTVRLAPTRIDKVSYRYLDFAWAQWEGPKHGDSFRLSPTAYRDQQTAAAKARGLKLMFGLNYLNGGDGSSGVLGTYDNPRAADRWQMSASEVKKVGAVLAAAPYACGVLSWQWDSRFAGRTGMASAMSYVGSVARNRSRTSCK